MKKIKVESKISDMQKIVDANRITEWMDALEARDATVRLSIEVIDPREGTLVEIE